MFITFVCLATVDVESLYPNIKQRDAMKAVRWALEKQTDLKQPQIKFLLEGLHMDMSNIWHNGEFFNQIKGVAMGSGYAPSILFLSKLEEELIFSRN